MRAVLVAAFLVVGCAAAAAHDTSGLPAQDKRNIETLVRAEFAEAPSPDWVWPKFNAAFRDHGTAIYCGWVRPAPGQRFALFAAMAPNDDPGSKPLWQIFTLASVGPAKIRMLLDGCRTAGYSTDVPA